MKKINYIIATSIMLAPSITAADSTFNHGLFNRDATDITAATKEAFTATAGISYTIVVILIIIGSYFWLFSAGDPGKYQKGKQYIKTALLGAFLTTLAYAILRLFGASY